MPVPVIPPSVVEAICRVQLGMSAVKKDGRNQHGSYAYASTDAIYAAITLKLAEAGLVVLCLEEHPPEVHRIEKDGKTSQWGRFTFQFVLATKDATWSDPRSRRSLFIPITGAQTFQAAQSYAEKTYLRSLLKIATGDLDLDSLPQSDTEEGMVSLNGNGKPRKSSAEGKRDGSVKLFNQIRGDIHSALNREHLIHLRETYAEEWSTMPPRWADTLDEEYETKMMSFPRAEAAE